MYVDEELAELVGYSCTSLLSAVCWLKGRSTSTVESDLFVVTRTLSEMSL